MNIGVSFELVSSIIIMPMVLIDGYERNKEAGLVPLFLIEVYISMMRSPDALKR